MPWHSTSCHGTVERIGATAGSYSARFNTPLVMFSGQKDNPKFLRAVTLYVLPRHRGGLSVKRTAGLNSACSNTLLVTFSWQRHDINFLRAVALYAMPRHFGAIWCNTDSRFGFSVLDYPYGDVFGAIARPPVFACRGISARHNFFV